MFHFYHGHQTLQTNTTPEHVCLLALKLLKAWSAFYAATREPYLIFVLSEVRDCSHNLP
eukprot:c40654_g1_i1 orf=113-289(+)